IVMKIMLVFHEMNTINVGDLYMLLRQYANATFRFLNHCDFFGLMIVCDTHTFIFTRLLILFHLCDLFLIIHPIRHGHGDDNVFVNVVASVQYRALADKASDAFYRLSNTREQIQSYVFDVIRASVPKMNLDDAFEQKNEIAKAVENELEKTLIVDIEPDEHVKRAMNEINAGKKGEMGWILAQLDSYHQDYCSSIPINIMFIVHEINMDTKTISHIAGFLIPVNVITLICLLIKRAEGDAESNKEVHIHHEELMKFWDLITDCRIIT
ncbi:hypothetical protein ACJX0J_020314, partial [Zea mays]